MKKYINQFYGISLLVTLLVIASVFGMFRYMDTYLEEQAESILKAKSDSLASNITSHIKIKSQVVSDVALYIESDDTLKDETLLPYLQNILAENHNLESIYFVSKDNYIVTGSNWVPPANYDLTARKWYQDSIQKDSLHISETYATASDGQDIISISKPVFDYNNDLIGVVSADLTIKRMIDIILAEKEDDLHAFLIDNQQVVIAYSKDLKPTTYNLAEIHPGLIPGYEKADREPIPTSINDSPGYILFKKIDGTDLVLATFISLEAFKGYQEHLMMILFYTLLAIIIIFMTMFLLHRRLLVAPLITLDQDIQKVALDEDITYRLPLTKKDPFLLIRKSTNQILNSAENFFTDLAENHQELEATNEELIATFEQLDTYEEEIKYKDQLTGLLNRRFFEEKLEQMNYPEYLPLAMLMIDVNGLKLTNDAFGHETGDKLLKKVASLLENHTTEDGFLARIGGDEFAMVYPNTTKEETIQFVDDLYHHINNQQLGNTMLSISVGSAVRSSMDETMKDVFIRSEDHMYRRKITEGQSMRNQTIQVIMQTLNEKSEREKKHSVQVSEISRKIGEAMGLNTQVLGEVETAGLLHDIGKISIRDEVLNKAGRLTDEEYAEIKKHPESSYQILKSVDAYSSLAQDVLSHHERYDGKGYPNGLKGDEIPLIARIISVADAYEAMIADRSYRKGMSQKAALEEVKHHAGTQFDPVVVDYFLTIF